MSKLITSILLIDLGNTRAKWGLLDQNGDITGQDLGIIAGTVNYRDPNDQNLFFKDVTNWSSAPDQIVCVSVTDPQIAKSWENFFKSIWPKVKWNTFNSYCSIKHIHSDYITPETFGPDRWAALFGAQIQSPGKDVLVINAGTATTIDLLTKDGVYKGGWIIPGFDLMLSSLAHGTASLPDLRNPQNSSISLHFGQSTHDCMRQGCLATQIGAITTALSLSGAKTIIFSGGNAALLAKHIHEGDHSLTISTDPHLVLRGLYRWFKENQASALDSSMPEK